MKSEQTMQIVESFAAFAPTKDDNVFGSLADVLSNLKQLLSTYGCAHKETIIAEANKAIDVIIAVNIPQVPDFIENILDMFLSKIAKKAIEDIVARMCAGPDPKPNFPTSK